jgi:glycolate oxidase
MELAAHAAGVPWSLETFKARLAATLGERLRIDAEACGSAAGDESGLPKVPPAAVCQVRTIDEVRRICVEASQLGIGLVPRGGGSGKAGGCIPRAQDVVVDCSQMASILNLQVRHQFADVQPGVINIDLDRAAAEEGFMYPPDPASLESCTLGGNIATNAGGPRAVKYGVTANYVWGLDVMRIDGSLLRMGRRSIKGVAGLNLTGLMVGSQGVLGFIVGATLHIVPRPREVATAWLTFDSLAAACAAGDRVFAAGVVPCIMEIMDRTVVDLVRPVSRFKAPQGEAALLVETDGGDAEAQLLRLCERAEASATLVAASVAQAEDLRRARRLVSGRLKEAYPRKYSDDLAVPRGDMGTLLQRAKDIAGTDCSVYGHLGDGNVHINVLSGDKVLRDAIVQEAWALGGTVTGEHGIGLAKREDLLREQGPALVALQAELKSVFDPRGLMNPGK